MVVGEALSIDIERIRADFPVLRRTVHGKPLVYLDNAATSQKPEIVIETVERYYREYNANVHRGIHTLSEEATLAYERAREKLAKFIDAEGPQEVVFVRNATEAINLVAHSWGRSNITQGDLIVLTEMEHHSNLIPWQLLAREKRARLEFVGIDDQGLLKWDDYERLVAEGPKLVGFTYASNVLGTINSVKKMLEYAHEHGAVAVIDGAQAVPHMPVDVREIGCDFMAISGHKMLGPTGIGALYARRELLEGMEPFMGGGEMIKEVHLREARWNDLPWKFEAGTPNIVGGIGLGAAVDYLSTIGMRNVRDHEKEITRYALERMGEVKGVTIYGPRTIENRGAVISFNLGDIHAHDLATILDEEGIAIRSGHHCAQPLMERLRVPATSRASFYIYNTRGEVDTLVRALEKARKLFRL